MQNEIEIEITVPPPARKKSYVLKLKKNLL